MMNWMRKCKGSISIFLCLIMLPMITYSSMIIDGSRLQSSRLNITAAGDLTMNAALSEYEHILEEMYGLFAVSYKNEGEMREALKSYFTQTIENSVYSSRNKTDYASGLSDTIVNMIMNGNTDEKDFTNLVRMKVEDFSCNSVPGEALANPNVMKRQIIDYMKYKGPVSLASTLFSKLDFLKDSSKQTDAIQKKVDYAKALSDIDDPCVQIYNYIVSGDYSKGDLKAFDDLKNSNAISYNMLVASEGDISGYEYNQSINTDLASKSVTDRVAEIKTNLERAAYLKTLEINTPDFSDWKKSKFENLYKDEYNNLKKCTEGSENTSGEMKTKIDKIIGVMNGIVNLSGGSPGTLESLLDVIYADHREETINDDTNPRWNKIKDGGVWRTTLDVPDGIADFDTAKAKLSARFDLQNKLAGSNINEVLGKYYCYEKVYDECLAYLYTLEDDYAAKRYEEIDDSKKTDKEKDAAKEIVAEQYNDMVSQWNEFQCVNGFIGEYDSKIDEIYKLLKDQDKYDNYVKTYIQNAVNIANRLYRPHKLAQQLLEKAVKNMDTVVKKIEDADKKGKEWQSSIDKVDSGSVHENMQADHDTSVNKLDLAKAKKLQQFFKDQKEILDKRCNYLLAIKFYDKELANGDRDDFVSKLKKDNSLKLTDKSAASLENAAKTCIDTNFKYQSDSSMFDSKLEPIEGLKSFESDKPVSEDEEFMLTIISIATAKSTEMSEETKNDLEQLEKDSKTTDGSSSSESAKEAKKHDSKLVKDKDAVDKANADFAKTMAQIEKYISSEGEVTADSFSGDGASSSDVKIEGDKKADNVEIPKEKKKIKKADTGNSLKNATDILAAIGDLGTKVRDAAYLEEYFTELFTCQTDALDGKDFQLLNGYKKDNVNTSNPWFGKEIEYILWGGNLDSNLTYNEALIFVIRFALNAIYAFTAADIQSFALEAATAIAGWTVVGVPIVQACITIAIALAESAYDLVLLKDGEDVVIYKNASTFVCSPTGFASNVAKKAMQKVAEAAIGKIEEELDNVVDNITDAANKKISDVINDTTTGLNDVVGKFADSTTESIKSSIEDLFVVPILNELTTIQAYASTAPSDLSDFINSRLDNVLDSVIAERIKNMDAGPVKEVTEKFYNQFKSTIKTNISSLIYNYFTTLTSADQFSPNVIKTKIDEELDKYINDDSFKSNFDALTKQWSDELTTSLKNATNETATNLKSFMHEKMDGITQKVSGTPSASKVNLRKDNAKSDDLIESKYGDTGTASSGLTLNYKEYCKIFILLHIATDEQIMMKRAAVLVQHNVQSAKSRAVPSFNMTKADTMVSVNASVKMATLFPWMAKDTISETSGDSKVSLDMSHLGDNYVSISYNGVTGY